MLLNVGHLLLFSSPLKLSVSTNTFCIWSHNIMARIMGIGCLNLLVLFVVSTNLMNSLDAQPSAPAPEPSAPTPEPVAPAPEPSAPTPEPVAPTPEPVAPAPEPLPPPTPSPISPSPLPTPPPTPNPNSPPPAPLSAPAPPAAGKGSSGLSGGQKAGIVIGVLVGAVLIGLGGMVFMKRQKNIRRNSYGNAARSVDL